MEMENYIDNMKNFQEMLLEYLDNDDADTSLLPNIIVFFKNQKSNLSRDKLRSFIDLISNICKNHHRSLNFFSKTWQVLHLIKEEITQFFSNFEIFKLFESNKRILLFLFDEKILQPEQLIADLVLKDKLFESEYHLYFFPELNSFYGKENKQKFFKETYEFHQNSFDEFNEKRKIGENDNELYELIRCDSIDEFITLVNKKDLRLTSKIRSSLFETNSFLLKNKASLIEYSAFFGSIQIFRYLYLNGVELTPLIWFYVIHGRNPELIHILKESSIVPDDDSYKSCLNESMKCYHKELTTYIEENLLKKIENDDFDLSIQGMKYKNYFYFPNDLINELSYYYFCKYNYIYLYKLLLKLTYLKINTKIISTNIFGFYVVLNSMFCSSHFNSSF